ncbi:MAG TPA: hypothetical protein DD435_07435 [Cyanobacteria bacterium UBA8530]|nr:hypothetical protein [Cyanobacteria bacterium UBA8530]
MARKLAFLILLLGLFWGCKSPNGSDPLVKQPVPFGKNPRFPPPASLPFPAKKDRFAIALPVAGINHLFLYEEEKKDLLEFPGAGEPVFNPRLVDEKIAFDDGQKIWIYDLKKECRFFPKGLGAIEDGGHDPSPSAGFKRMPFIGNASGEVFLLEGRRLCELTKVNAVAKKEGGVLDIDLGADGIWLVFLTEKRRLYLYNFDDQELRLAVGACEIGKMLSISAGGRQTAILTEENERWRYDLLLKRLIPLEYAEKAINPLSEIRIKTLFLGDEEIYFVVFPTLPLPRYGFEVHEGGIPTSRLDK